MKERRKIPWGQLYLVATIVVLIIFGVVNQEFANVFTTLSSISFNYIAIAVVTIIIFFLFEGGIIHYLLNSQGESLKFATSMKIGLIGIYYSYITPSSTGGQPAQVAYLRRDKVSIGSSVAALFVKFFAYQTAFVLCSIVSFALMYNNIAELNSNLIPFIWLGIAINSCWIIVIPLMFSNTVLRKMCGFLRKLVDKIKFIKKKDKYKLSITKFEDDFADYASRFGKKKRKVLVSILVSIPQVILQMIVLFFIFRAFGYNNFSVVDITSMQTLLQVSVCFMPMPGASGAQEIGFSSFFRSYFTNNDLYTAVMVWRFFTYYIVVIAGAILIVVDSVLQSRRKKQLVKS